VVEWHGDFIIENDIANASLSVGQMYRKFKKRSIDIGIVHVQYCLLDPSTPCVTAWHPVALMNIGRREMKLRFLFQQGNPRQD